MKKLMGVTMLIIFAIVFVGCSTKTAEIRKVTTSTNSVSTTPDTQADNTPNSSNPNKAEADTSGEKALQLTKITIKVVGNNAENFCKNARIEWLMFSLQNKQNKSVDSLEYTGIASNTQNFVLASKRSTSSPFAIGEDCTLVDCNIFLRATFNGRQLSKENLSLVAPLNDLSDTDTRACFYVHISDDIKIAIICDFKIDFLQSV